MPRGNLHNVGNYKGMHEMDTCYRDALTMKMMIVGVVGLPFGYPTVVVPGSRQEKPIGAHEVYRVAQVAG